MAIFVVGANLVTIREFCEEIGKALSLGPHLPRRVRVIEAIDFGRYLPIREGNERVNAAQKTAKSEGRINIPRGPFCLRTRRSTISFPR
jgi:hypothetical protein